MAPAVLAQPAAPSLRGGAFLASLFRGLLLLVLLLAGGGLRAEAPLPEAPVRFVTDGTGFLSPGVRERLDRRLAAYQRATGHQVLVWIGPTTGGAPLEDWTVRAFAAWKPGRQGKDDGLALFLFVQDQKLRLEVGYGLEGVLPDATASRIIREAILPRLKEGDHDGAVMAGVDRILETVGGETGAPRQGRGTRGQPLTLGGKVMLGLLALGLLLLVIKYPEVGVWILYAVLSGGRGGGRGGGGGSDGFSGGGGRGGGGGASGSW